jgi:ABC-type sugar transport system ATPase subunit
MNDSKLDNPVLSAKGISKRYGGVQALDNVDIDLHLGRVVALVGQNGAGKSTLIKVISGAVQPDTGTIYLDGQPIQLSSVQVGQQVGIRVIHQIPALAPDLSVLDNVFLGSETLDRRNWFLLPKLDRNQMKERLQPFLDMFASNINSDARLSSLKAHEQRLVGIVKALVGTAHVLILDEPTAALPADERSHLLETVRRLRDQGLAILYVSHHLDEIEQVADEVVALRDGRLVGHEVGALKPDRIVTMMVGQDVVASRAPIERPMVALDAEVFEFEVTPPTIGNQVTEVTRPVNIQLRASEIVILTGLVGSGITDVVSAAFGGRSGWGAKLTNSSGEKIITDPHMAIDLGVGYLSDDRIGQSMLPDLSIRANMSIAALNTLVNRPWGKINKKLERDRVRKQGDDLQLRRDEDGQLITELSGGNQQKVMIGRWLFSGSRLLILNEPTQGIDVIAKAEVMQILSQFTRDGGAVLIVTTDAEEFLPYASRVLVMRHGRLTANLTGDDLTPTAVTGAVLLAEHTGDQIK